MKFIFIIIFYCAALHAGTDGTLRGQITLPDGSGLPGTQIYLEDTQFGMIADEDGSYLILNIPVGEYTVVVSMIGYKTRRYEKVKINMDQTVYLNIQMEKAAIEGDVITVTGEKPLVEKGTTSKKVIISSEDIQSLPIRDVTELYSLQSGLVKVEAGAKGAIGENESKGLQEIHVRGGRSGEIAYMVDGMYIRNPIYGDIGTTTRMNLFAIREWDWQVGGFNAEYGDAMSAVSNWHTMYGTKDLSYKFQYSTSLVGAVISEYDNLRDYNDYSFGLGGSFLDNKIGYWVSTQYTSNGSSRRVYEFDDVVYDPNDPANINNNANLVLPWDTTGGFRAFGYDKTYDIFTKLNFNFERIRFNIAYWTIVSQLQPFSTQSLYGEIGQYGSENEIIRNTDRFSFEFNHQLGQKNFYTIRYARFNQSEMIGSRWMDSDDDGYPDWFEWTYSAGENRPYSDPDDSNMIPYSMYGDSVIYTQRDGDGPQQWSSGWYYGATPGNYNWDVAEEFTDVNHNGVYDEGVDTFDIENDDLDGDGSWTGPALVDSCIWYDGSYWLTPEMYVNYETFSSFRNYDNIVTSDPYSENEYLNDPNANYSDYFDMDSLYWVNANGYGWFDGNFFGGHAPWFTQTNVQTDEIRFDFTSQLTDRYKLRTGVNYRYHKLDYYDVFQPWNDVNAQNQRFAEFWFDYGLDGTDRLDTESKQPDEGEGNGQWDPGPGDTWDLSTQDCGLDGICAESEADRDEGELNGAFDCDEEGNCEDFNDVDGDGIYEPGEVFYDFNGNNQWDDYVEPEEFALYIQQTYEVPWMVINAGVRLDAVNYNTKIWSRPYSDEYAIEGAKSPTRPFVFSDCGWDGLCAADNDESTKSSLGVHVVDTGENDGIWQPGDTFEDLPDEEGNKNGVWDEGEKLINDYNNNGEYDPGEGTSTDLGLTNSKVFFQNSDWLYKISPRVGFSHVITDNSTFIFNYGLYYQTPVYKNIYLNINRQSNPTELFEETDGGVGNATMVAQRTQAYEFGVNVGVGDYWAFSILGWVKDMDQLATAKSYSSGSYNYQIYSNGDYGTAKGIDFTLENRISPQFPINTMLQYTYSTAKANGDYDAAAFGALWVDAASQEYLMYYDRTHDLSLTMYTFIPFVGVVASITGLYQSGTPYTPIKWNGDKPEADLLNKNTERMPDYKKVNMSFSKGFEIGNSKVSLGLSIYNLFDTRNTLDIYDITGRADNPGDYYNQDIGLPGEGGLYSGSYFDRPWMYTRAREINSFIKIEFN